MGSKDVKLGWFDGYELKMVGPPHELVSGSRS